MTASIDLLADLQARGLVHQLSSPDLGAALQTSRITAYIGFDPTAASLHVGSLLPVLNLVRLQRAGHRPIAVVGGGTGLIGDPSGKQAERQMLTKDKLAENLNAMRAQLERFLDFSEGNALLVDNGDWLNELKLVDFLRDIGKHFSVNAMIARDSVKMRLEQREQGISYTEFSYMLMQSYDFLHLHDRYGCTLQMGGSDQWGNIVSGADLIRRLREKDAYALTSPLITRSDGQKFGKSEAGNIWVDPKLTSPYAFYQFWRNADDRDVGPWLKYLTLLPLHEINEVIAAHEAAPHKRGAQQALADWLTRFVHGEEALARAHKASAVLFGQGSFKELTAEELDEALKGAPMSPLAKDALGTPSAQLVSVLAEAGVSPSKGQARKDIEGGAIALNSEKIKDVKRVIGTEDVLAGRYVVIGRGKKGFHVLRVE